jgi:hypothetical protein
VPVVSDRDGGGRAWFRTITPDTTFKQQPPAEKNGLLVSGFASATPSTPGDRLKALDLIGRPRSLATSTTR